MLFIKVFDITHKTTWIQQEEKNNLNIIIILLQGVPKLYFLCPLCFFIFRYATTDIANYISQLITIPKGCPLIITIPFVVVIQKLFKSELFKTQTSLLYVIRCLGISLISQYRNNPIIPSFKQRRGRFVISARNFMLIHDHYLVHRIIVIRVSFSACAMRCR